MARRRVSNVGQFKGELDPADDVRRHFRKKTKEGCDHGSEVGTVHSSETGNGELLLRKPKEFGRRDNRDKGFVSRQHKGMLYLCNDRGYRAGNPG